MPKLRPRALTAVLLLAVLLPVRQPAATAFTAQTTCVNRPFRAFLAQVSLPGSLPPSPGLLTDGGFDMTPRIWNAYSKNGFDGIYSGASADWQRFTKSQIAPRSVPNALLFPSCAGLDEFAVVSQTIVVPADARTLSYYSIGLSREIAEPGGICPDSPDIGQVRIDGSPIDTVRLCERLDANGDPLPIFWERRAVTITAYSGRTVTLAFVFEADDQDGSAWLVDDVSLSSAAGAVESISAKLSP
jgi:hypothetical protein